MTYVTPPEWPRSHNWFWGPIHIFRNPDCGVLLDINGWRLLGVGSCFEGRYHDEPDFRCNWRAEVYCVKPYGHDGDHSDQPGRWAA